MNRDRPVRPTPLLIGLLDMFAFAAHAVRRDGKRKLAVLCAVATLLSANTAFALDCVKARTPAEKTICSNSALQQLDSELNAVYRDALKASSDPKVLSAAQRVWLKKRDAMASAGFFTLQSAYIARINTLRTLRCESLSKPASSRPPGLKAAPAYPDVWEFMPNSGQELTGMVLLPDGDVGLRLNNEKSGEVGFKRFFFDRPLTPEDQCRIRSNVGMAPFPATLPDGRIITIVGGEDWTPRTHCYLGPATSVLVYSTGPQSAAKYPLIEKTFLYVLGKPQHVENGNICESNPSEHFNLRVIALPYFQFMPLPDGSFLVMSTGGRYVGLPGFVMRFNSHFQTRSQILKGKLFIVDTAKLKRWLYRADFRDDALMQRGLLRWLTVKKQGRR